MFAQRRDDGGGVRKTPERMVALQPRGSAVGLAAQDQWSDLRLRCQQLLNQLISEPVDMGTETAPDPALFPVDQQWFKR